MEAMLLRVHPRNPERHKIAKACKALTSGSLVIYPTDTIYAVGCELRQPKAIQQLHNIKHTQQQGHLFSLLFRDITQVSKYTEPISSETFKLMRRILPGPYTIVLKANKKLRKAYLGSRKTIGIRIPDHPIVGQLLSHLPEPLLTTSLRNEEDVVEYHIDPEFIYQEYKHLVDIVINGGQGGLQPSTVLDCSSGEVQLLRKGKGNTLEL